MSASGFFAVGGVDVAGGFGGEYCCGIDLVVMVGLNLLSCWSVDHCGKGFKGCSVMVGRLDPAMWECFCVSHWFGGFGKIAVVVHAFMPILVDVYIMWQVAERL